MDYVAAIYGRTRLAANLGLPATWRSGLRGGLQSPLHRFDSGRRLATSVRVPAEVDLHPADLVARERQDLGVAEAVPVGLRLS